MGNKNDIIHGTPGNDALKGGNGKDKIFGNGGNDTISGGNGKDVAYGGSGADLVKGNNGKDVLFGDGPAECVTGTTDFYLDSNWGGLSGSQTQLNVPGLTITAIGGVLTKFHGLSVLSPSDNLPAAWTQEIDAYNDTQEGLHLAFAKAQSTVTITLHQLYREQLFSPEFVPEKAQFVIHFTDGTSTVGTVQGVQTALPGETSFTLSGDDYGCRMIASVDLLPDLATPPLPPGLPPIYANSYNATHPFSEFTLKSVTFTRDANNDPGNDDKLIGGNGADTLYGGLGNDILCGGNGPDLLFGGAGDNLLIGGKGPDTFVFGFEANGANVITDLKLKTDHIRLDDGVVISSVTNNAGNAVLHLSNGGTVELVGVAPPSDWSVLY